MLWRTLILLKYFSCDNIWDSSVFITNFSIYNLPMLAYRGLNNVWVPGVLLIYVQHIILFCCIVLSVIQHHRSIFL